MKIIPKKIIALVYTLLTISLLSCKKDPEPYMYKQQNGWIYYGGDGVVNTQDNVAIDFDIQNNLNVNGTVTFTDYLSIKNDLNINQNGKTIIATQKAQDTIKIYGNVNLNDSMLVKQGVVLIYGNLNINATGILNVSDNAKMCISKDINNSGKLFGNQNIKTDGSLHQNAGSTTKTTPL
jgi:hypothetical protein